MFLGRVSSPKLLLSLNELRMSCGTGTSSAPDSHTCKVCNVTLSSFMSFQIHCSGYLHSSNLAAKNVQQKAKNAASKQDASQAKRNESSASGEKKMFDMFDPFISEDEVKTYLKKNKRQQGKRQQGNQGKQGNPGKGHQGVKHMVNQIPCLMRGIAPETKQLVTYSSQEPVKGSMSSGGQVRTSSYYPGGSHSQGVWKKPGNAAQNRDPVIDLTKDDRAGYLNELQDYKNMRNESVLQSQLALLNAAKGTSGGQIHQTSQKGYQKEGDPMESAIKNTLASLPPGQKQPIVMTPIVPNLNCNVGSGLLPTPSMGTVLMAGTPLGPNDLQFYFNNSLRAEDVMVEKHKPIEECRSMPFSLDIGIGACMICPGRPNAIHRAVDWFCHVEGKKHDQNVQALIQKETMPEVKRKYGIYSIPQKYLSQMETYQLVQDILRHYDKMFPAQMQKQIKGKYCAYIILTGQQFKYECKLCSFHGRHMSHWVSHVLGSAHAKVCITSLVKLGLNEYLKEYENLPGPNPQNYWPVTKQFPLCLLPGIQGSGNLDNEAYKWNGFVHMDMADPKNNIMSRLKDGKLRPKSATATNQQQQQQPDVTASASAAGPSVLGRMPTSMGMNRPSNPGTTGSHMPTVSGVQPLMSLPVPGIQGQRNKLPKQMNNPINSQQGQAQQFKGTPSARQQTNVAATATAPSVSNPGGAQPNADLVALVQQKVQAEVLNSVQQNTVLLKAFLGALVQKINSDGNQKPADPPKKVVLDYSHGQKRDPKDKESLTSMSGDNIKTEDMEISGDEAEDQNIEKASSAILAAAPWKSQTGDAGKSQDLRPSRNEPKQTQPSRNEPNKTQPSVNDTHDSNKSSQSLIKWTYNWTTKQYSKETVKGKPEEASNSKQRSEKDYKNQSTASSSSAMHIAASAIPSMAHTQRNAAYSSASTTLPHAAQVPTTQHSSQVPSSLSRAQQIPSLSHAQQIPSLSHAQQIPSISRAQQIPSLSHARQVPSFSHGQQIPSFSHGQQVPSFSHAQHVPSFSHAQQISSLSYAQQVSAMQSNPMMMPPTGVRPPQVSHVQTPPVMYMQPQVMSLPPVVAAVSHAGPPPGYQPQNVQVMAHGMRPPVMAAGVPQGPVMTPRQVQPHTLQPNAVPGVRMPSTQAFGQHYPPGQPYAQSSIAQVGMAQQQAGIPPVGMTQQKGANLGRQVPGQNVHPTAANRGPAQMSGNQVSTQAPWQSKKFNKQNTAEQQASEVQKAFDMVDQERNRADFHETRHHERERDSNNKIGEADRMRPRSSRFDNEEDNGIKDNKRDYSPRGERSHSRDRGRQRYDDDTYSHRRHDGDKERVSREHDRNARPRSRDRSHRDRLDERDDTGRSQERRRDRHDGKGRRDDAHERHDDRVERRHKDRDSYDRTARDHSSSREHRSQSNDKRGYRDENERRRLYDSQDQHYRDDESRERRRHRGEKHHQDFEERGHKERHYGQDSEDLGDVTSQDRDGRAHRSRARDGISMDKDERGNRSRTLDGVSQDKDDRAHRSRAHDNEELHENSRDRKGDHEEESKRRKRHKDEHRQSRRHEDAVDLRRYGEDETYHGHSYREGDAHERGNDDEEDMRDGGWHEDEAIRSRDSNDHRKMEKEERHRKRRYENTEDLYGKRRQEDHHAEDARDRRRYEDEENLGRREHDEDYRESQVHPDVGLTSAEVETRLQELIYSLGIRDESMAAPLMALAAQMDPVTLQQLLNPDFLTAVGQLRQVLEDGSDPTMLGTLLNSDVMKDEGIYQLLQLLGLDVVALRVLHDNHRRRDDEQLHPDERTNTGNARREDRRRRR